MDESRAGLTRAVILGAGKPARGQSPAALFGLAGDGRVLDWQVAALRPHCDEVVFVGGYRFAEIVALFHSDAPKMLEELRSHIGSGDATSLEKTAHRLKGALGTLAALAAREVAEKLETLGREGNILGAGQELTALEREIERLRPELAALAARGPISGDVPSACAPSFSNASQRGPAGGTSRSEGS